MGISVESYRQKLVEEGFQRVYLWRDRPGARQMPHFHTCDTAHIVIDGDLEIKVGGETRALHWGERADLPAGTMHAVRTGPQGCILLIGERG